MEFSLWIGTFLACFSGSRPLLFEKLKPKCTYSWNVWTVVWNIDIYFSYSHLHKARQCYIHRTHCQRPFHHIYCLPLTWYLFLLSIPILLSLSSKRIKAWSNNMHWCVHQYGIHAWTWSARVRNNAVCARMRRENTTETHFSGRAIDNAIQIVLCNEWVIWAKMCVYTNYWVIRRLNLRERSCSSGSKYACKSV